MNFSAQDGPHLSVLPVELLEGNGEGGHGRRDSVDAAAVCCAYDVEQSSVQSSHSSTSMSCEMMTKLSREFENGKSESRSKGADKI